MRMSESECREAAERWRHSVNKFRKAVGMKATVEDRKRYNFAVKRSAIRGGDEILELYVPRRPSLTTFMKSGVTS